MQRAGIEAIVGRSERGRSAFSLLEVIIALAILAFGILAVVAAQVATLDFSRRSRSATQAMYLAEQKMEEFQALSTASLAALGSQNDPNNPIDYDPGDDDATTYIRSWTISPDAPEAGITTITVTVTWTDQRNVARSFELDGMKADL